MPEPPAPPYAPILAWRGPSPNSPCHLRPSEHPWQHHRRLSPLPRQAAHHCATRQGWAGSAKPTALLERLPALGVSVTAMNHTNAEVTTLPLCGLETGISKAPPGPGKAPDSLPPSPDEASSQGQGGVNQTQLDSPPPAALLATPPPPARVTLGRAGLPRRGREEPVTLGVLQQHPSRPPSLPLALRLCQEQLGQVQPTPGKQRGWPDVALSNTAPPHR